MTHKTMYLMELIALYEEIWKAMEYEIPYNRMDAGDNAKA